MPAGDYGTSSIEWRRTEPKTYTLTNTEQYGGPKPDFEAEAQKLIQQRMMEAQADADVDFMEQERQGLEREKLPGRLENPPPRVKKMWRKQIRDFLSEADDPRSDRALGIQSLIDSGAVTYDEDGLWIGSNVNLGRKRNEAMVAAADEWADKVGLWQGGDFDPSRYQPYYSGEGARQTWETQQALSPEKMKELGRLMGGFGGK